MPDDLIFKGRIIRQTDMAILFRGLKKLKRKDLLEAILAGAPSKETEKIRFSKRTEA